MAIVGALWLGAVKLSPAGLAQALARGGALAAAGAFGSADGRGASLALPARRALARSGRDARSVA